MDCREAWPKNVAVSSLLASQYLYSTCMNNQKLKQHYCLKLESVKPHFALGSYVPLISTPGSNLFRRAYSRRTLLKGSAQHLCWFRDSCQKATNHRWLCTRSHFIYFISRVTTSVELYKKVHYELTLAQQCPFARNPRPAKRCRNRKHEQPH